MPELPEVETIRRALGAKIPGHHFQRVLVRDRRLRWPVDPRKLSRLAVGPTIQEVDRRAKYLLIRFEDGAALILHLGMSGRILMLPKGGRFEKHDHVVFYLSNGLQLRFRDPRRFGLVDAVAAGELDSHPRFATLGFEPLARTTRAKLLHEKASNSKRPIKNLLMDANFIVGVGNIYASEALFHAGIHPFTPSNLLGLLEWQKLLRAVRKVLRNAIEKGGTTLSDFVNSNGEMGYFQLSLAVYGKAGERCNRCGGLIERVVLMGRSTFFCTSCQPLGPEYPA